MRLLEEFLNITKDKENVMSFLDKYKDDPRPVTDLEAMAEYSELYTVFDDVLIEQYLKNTAQMDDDSIEEYEEYWCGHPTYKRMQRIQDVIDTCVALDNWSGVVFNRIMDCDVENLVGIWKYLEKLVKKNLQKAW